MYICSHRTTIKQQYHQLNLPLPLVRRKHSNTQVRQLEAKRAILPSFDGSSLAVDDVRSTNLIHRVYVGSSQDGQVGCHTSTNTLEGQRDWDVSGAIIHSCLEDVRVGLVV